MLKHFLQSWRKKGLPTEEMENFSAQMDIFEQHFRKEEDAVKQRQQEIRSKLKNVQTKPEA